MKKLLLLHIVLGFFITINAQNSSQLEEDQNPNYKTSLEKYVSVADQYTQQQGTTAQETYKAIDPLEEKRELRALRRQYRAQRPYWRHQRRLERIKNTQYYQYNTPWNAGFQYGNFGNYYNRHRFWGQNLLNLGLYGSCLF